MDIFIKDLFNVDYLAERYGDRWVLRDLDFFPEKLSTMARLYPYTLDTYIEAIKNEGFVSFETEAEALDACIKIYTKVLKRKVPYNIYERYYKATDKK